MKYYYNIIILLYYEMLLYYIIVDRNIFSDDVFDIKRNIRKGFTRFVILISLS